MILSRDPIINVIENGFKKDINVLLDNKRYRGALILIYSAIDAITFSSSPKDKTDRNDFMEWCDRYIRIVGIGEGRVLYKLNGLDLYSARCSLIHTYGHRLESDLSKQGKCCKIGYMNGRINQDFINSKKTLDNTNESQLVMVSVYDLADSLFKGINDYLIALYKEPINNSEKIQTFEKKITQYIHELNIKEEKI